MNDPFEQKLREQPFRQIPASWRREILSSTDASPILLSRLREWLWPSPAAWGALAVAWMLIALLRLATPLPLGNGNGVCPASNGFQQRQILLTQILETRS